MDITMHTYLRNERTLPFAFAGGAYVNGIAAGGPSGNG